VLNYGMAIELDMLHSYSDDDIVELSRRNPELCFERTSEGRLLVSPPSGWVGGGRELRLGAQLLAWNKRAGGGGHVFGPSAGFTLPDRALFAPDAAWISAEKLALLRILQPLDKFAPVCPDLAFELVSASDHPIMMRRKIETYIRNGALCAVLIDPEEHVVEMSRQNALHVAVGDLHRLEILLDLLPGATEPFELDLDELFAAP
jgi:Uma2 family endonuclease